LGNMSIGRIPAGNDDSSDSAFFKLNTSGAIHFANKWCKRANINYRNM
jgi:hypothetical protein